MGVPKSLRVQNLDYVYYYDFPMKKFSALRYRHHNDHHKICFFRTAPFSLVTLCIDSPETKMSNQDGMAQIMKLFRMLSWAVKDKKSLIWRSAQRIVRRATIQFLGCTGMTIFWQICSIKTQKFIIFYSFLISGGGNGTQLSLI